MDEIIEKWNEILQTVKDAIKNAICDIAQKGE